MNSIGGERVCRECLNDAFEGATLDESRFPPQCSHHEILIADVKDVLYRAVSKAYEQKEPEYRCKNRVYCYHIGCGIWIAPQDIVGQRAECKSCWRVTCTICKGKAHEGDCPDDPENQIFLEAATAHGYQRCHQCSRMVELIHGCNHITSVNTSYQIAAHADSFSCLCGAQFCYQCGAEWKTCGCPLWEQRNLIWEEHQDRPFGYIEDDEDAQPQFVIRDPNPPPALAAALPPVVQLHPVPVRRPADAEYVEHPVRNQARMENRRRQMIRARWRGACHHQEWRKVIRSEDACEQCSKVLANFLLVCQGTSKFRSVPIPLFSNADFAIFSGCDRRACVKCKKIIRQAFTRAP